MTRWPPLPSIPKSPWRRRAAEIIGRVLSRPELAHATTDQLRRALRDAYPWGLRVHYPYKVWLSEIRSQLAARPDPRQGKLSL